ncbi:MAG TPA: hypothetical protein VEB86_17660 [Chryseosolibacter sp.]|nr:hypothetical protein [Chryseosolibacter sp.]
MNNPHRVRFYFAAFILLLAFSCDREEVEPKKQGHASFSFASEAGSNGRASTGSTPAFILLSVENASGTLVLENEKLPLVEFGSEYVTESLVLETGSHRVLAFIVLDEDSKAIYATPKEGSEKADLVDNALPIHFLVSPEQSTTVTPQVIAVGNTDTPEQFGYASFGFDVVNPATMDVRVKVELRIGDVTYLDVSSTVVVSGFDAENVKQWSQEFSYDGQFGNDLSVKAGYHHYSFEVQQWGAHARLVVNGDYLLEASRQEVPGTFVLTGYAPARKLSHYVTYKKVTDGGEVYWEPQDRRRYEYNAAGKLERMTVSTFVDSVGSFIPLRYFVFSYTGANMTKISGYHSENDHLYLEERYEYLPDGNVMAITQDYVDGSNIDWVANFSYNFTNRVINATYSAANGGGFQYDLTLPYGNILTDRINRGSQLCNIGNYQYDKAINPFKHLGYMDFFLRNYSLNNRLTEDIEYFGCAFPTLIPEAYVFEYDAQGYPTASNTLYKGRNYETRTTYFYN